MRTIENFRRQKIVLYFLSINYITRNEICQYIMVFSILES